MKVSRLLEIVVLLLQRGSITAGELSERFGVSTRTIYRDIETLSAAHVPVYTLQGSGGGIALMEGYAWQRTLLSPQEAQSLLLALKTLQATRLPGVGAMLGKLGNLFQQSPEDWLEVDLAPWGSIGVNNTFDIIRESILQSRLVSFQYISSTGELSQRAMEPMKLFFKGHGWYLWGWCRLREDFRVFRLSRMRQVTALAEGFTRRPPPPPDPPHVDHSVKMRLRFAPEVLHRLYDEFDPDSIHKNGDGFYDVMVRFPMDDWVYGYLQGFGPFVEVLTPSAARAEMAARLRRTLLLYEDET